MANEQFRLIVTIDGAASRLPGEYATRDEALAAVVEAQEQTQRRYDGITLQRRVKDAAGKYGAWKEIEQFAGTASDAHNADADHVPEVAAPAEAPHKKMIIYVVQTKVDGKWETVHTTPDKIAAANKLKLEMGDPDSEEVRLYQYDENATSQNKDAKGIFHKVIKKQVAEPVITDHVDGADVSATPTQEVHKKAGVSSDGLSRDNKPEAGAQNSEPLVANANNLFCNKPSYKSIICILTALSVIIAVICSLSYVLAYVCSGLVIVISAILYVGSKQDNDKKIDFTRDYAKIFAFGAVLSIIVIGGDKGKKMHGFTPDGVWVEDRSKCNNYNTAVGWEDAISRDENLPTVIDGNIFAYFYSKYRTYERPNIYGSLHVSYGQFCKSTMNGIMIQENLCGLLMTTKNTISGSNLTKLIGCVVGTPCGYYAAQINYSIENNTTIIQNNATVTDDYVQHNSAADIAKQRRIVEYQSKEGSGSRTYRCDSAVVPRGVHDAINAAKLNVN